MLSGDGARAASKPSLGGSPREALKHARHRRSIVGARESRAFAARARRKSVLKKLRAKLCVIARFPLDDF